MKKVRAAAKSKSSVVARNPLFKAILSQTRTPAFERYLRDLLVRVCEINTTPNSNVAVMRAAEDDCFRILESELAGLSFAGARTERRTVNSAIKNHPHYSLLHFTKTPQRPDGLSPEETYAGRSNLLYIVPGATTTGNGQSVDVNAHVDVVAPYLLQSMKDRQCEFRHGPIRSYNRDGSAIGRTSP